MEAKFKILAVEFKKESYKFILNNKAGFTDMTLYPLLSIVNKQQWRHSSEFPTIILIGLHLAIFGDWSAACLSWAQ